MLTVRVRPGRSDQLGGQCWPLLTVSWCSDISQCWPQLRNNTSEPPSQQSVLLRPQQWPHHSSRDWLQLRQHLRYLRAVSTMAQSRYQQNWSTEVVSTMSVWMRINCCGVERDCCAVLWYRSCDNVAMFSYLSSATCSTINNVTPKYLNCHQPRLDEDVASCHVRDG